ncbi:MAG TPA: rhomboid family intramembrane serine protease [Fimbriimonadales bacterium]|nr:rhomboid family intramembrane serine protease [Fimbriimonadales bacterium]
MGKRPPGPLVNNAIYNFLYRSGSPFTYIVLGVVCLAFLLFWLGSGNPETYAFVKSTFFTPSEFLRKPWTIFTYWIFTADLGLLLFIGLGLYFFASSLEREYGTKRFALAFSGLVLICPISFWLGYLFGVGDVPLMTVGLPVAGCLVAWAARHPHSKILLFMVVPIEARWVGWLTVIGVGIGYGWGHPLFSIFALLPLGLCYLYATRRLKLPEFPRKQKRVFFEKDYEGLDPDKRRAAEEERRRLRELFERSWKQGDEEDK